MGLDPHRQVVAPPQPERSGRRCIERQPGPGHRGRRVLAARQHPGQELEEDLGLGVAAHGPDQMGERSVGRGGQHRGQRVGWPAAGPELGRVALLEGEADPTIVEEDPGRPGDEMGSEVEGVGLGERDAQAVGVDGAQVGGVPVAQAGDRDAGSGTGGRARRPVAAARSASDPAGTGARAGRSARRACPSAPSWSTAGRSCPAARDASTTRWAHSGSDGSLPMPSCSAIQLLARVR